MILEIVSVVLVASAFVDGLSTVHFLKKGYIENNPLFGQTPSKTRIFLEGGLIIAAEIGIGIGFNDISHWAGLAVAVGLLVQSAYHIKYAVGNFKV